MYAGGDVASMARFVTEAIGMGKRAAHEIDRALRRARRDAERRVTRGPSPSSTSRRSTRSTTRGRRARRAARCRRAALATDAEVQIGLELEQALAETERCFSCGTCIHCDNCVDYCPDLAVKREADGYVVLTDYCKGCGLCVKECPTGSMKMIEESR